MTGPTTPFLNLYESDSSHTELPVKFRVRIPSPEITEKDKNSEDGAEMINTCTANIKNQYA